MGSTNSALVRCRMTSNSLQNNTVEIRRKIVTKLGNKCRISSCLSLDNFSVATIYVCHWLAMTPLFRNCNSCHAYSGLCNYCKKKKLHFKNTQKYHGKQIEIIMTLRTQVNVFYKYYIRMQQVINNTRKCNRKYKHVKDHGNINSQTKHVQTSFIIILLQNPLHVKCLKHAVCM